MKKILITLGAMAMAVAMNARDCDLHVQVVPPTAEMCDGHPEISNMLATRLMNAMTAAGVTADENYGQFYISARFDHLFKETVAGPPVQTALHTNLTLMVADLAGGKVFDSQSFELRGVGTSEQRAFLNALSQLNGKNNRLREFVDRAQDKVISYFDKNYKGLLAKAQTAAARNDYDQALYYSSLIPQCCTGYAQAEAAMLKYYHAYIDREGVKLLNAAKHAFAVSPNAEGAAEAYALLEQIDPSSSAYARAMTFADEVKRQTKVEYDFEVHQKYEDQMGLRRQLIDSARQVGVAYGNGQKSTTTNILWH